MPYVLQYELTVYADEDGDMPPSRVQRLFSDMATIQGTASSPLEYVAPIPGGDPQPWGLRAVIIGGNEEL